MEFISGNIFIRPMAEIIYPGWIMPGHTHNFDHTSIFFVGHWSIKIWSKQVDSNGKELFNNNNEQIWVQTDEYKQEAPFHLLIKANQKHELEYLGCVIPDWMQKYLKQLADDQAELFKLDYEKTNGRAWCVYSHRSPQGDVIQHFSGFDKAYQ